MMLTEKSMSLLESLQVSAFGMSVVFIALIGLCIIITLLTKILGAIRTGNKANETTAQSLPVQTTASSVSAAPASSEGLKLINVDEKTAAIVMAIVCDELKTDPAQLNFKYIKLVDNNA